MAALSESRGLSIRQTVIETTSRRSFIGTPRSVAAAMERFVAEDAADGFIRAQPARRSAGAGLAYLARTVRRPGLRAVRSAVPHDPPLPSAEAPPGFPTTRRVEFRPCRGHGRRTGTKWCSSPPPEDALTVDGRPFTGSVRLAADHAPDRGNRVAHGDRRLAVRRREGLGAVRDFGPDAPARTAFRGIEATAYDPRWVLPGRLRPYEEHTGVRLENADGRERGPGTGGEILPAAWQHPARGDRGR